MLHANAGENVVMFAICHANAIINNTPTRANRGKTPNEMELGGTSLPFNRRLCVAPFGCLAFAHVYRNEPPRAGNKDAARAVVCMYLGFDDVSYQYIIKEWSSGKIFYSADVDFQPNRFPCRADPRHMNEFIFQFEDLRPYVGTRIGGVEDMNSSDRTYHKNLGASARQDEQRRNRHNYHPG